MAQVEKYCREMHVVSTDSDLRGQMKPVAFLNMAQEAANVHADYLGVGYDSITSTRRAWVLARMHTIFHRMPRWREKITLRSWHKRAEGLSYYRDFEVCDEQGARLISSTTTWLVMNIDTRRLVRQNDFGDEGLLGIDEDVIVEPAAKVVMPQGEAERVCEVTAAYSDIDINGHVNNVNYTVWAMNAMPEDVVLQRPLREITVNYNAEIRCGERVEIFRMQDAEHADRYYVEGRVEGRTTFVARLDF